MLPEGEYYITKGSLVGGSEISAEVEAVKNAEDTIPLVEFDSRLGFEPSMEYMTDKAHIDWKLNLIKDVIEKELPSYYEK